MSGVFILVSRHKDNKRFSIYRDAYLSQVNKPPRDLFTCESLIKFKHEIKK